MAEDSRDSNSDSLTCTKHTNSDKNNGKFWLKLFFIANRRVFIRGGLECFVLVVLMVMLGVINCLYGIFIVLIIKATRSG